MECIEFFQVFITCFRSLTSSSSSSSTSSVAAVDTDIPPLQDSSSSVGAADTDILPLKERYDVFLSFRGEDTRLAFTSHLHKALLGKKIETYIDDRLVRGDEIAPALLEAIARSTISVIIFSEKYASSTWCLKELVHILGCKKRYGQFVLPIFYLIDPSDLRNKKGTYALALDELAKRFKGSTDEVVNWRDALKEAADMAGFHYSSKTGRTEADFVEEVVQGVLTKLNSQSSGDLKDSPVGIEKKIEKIESLLCLDSPGVCCVGIWGMGGIGKTTLAEAVFHRQMRSSKFEVCCFLANVRENSEKTDGLHHLRKKLVGEILNDKDVNIDTPSLPANILIRLRRTKALIVLDDVNARKQLEYLVGDDDRFCQGSRIIITARDKGLLEQKVDHENIYNVEGLGSDEALELFHSHAFGNKSPTAYCPELSREVVDYIKGIPLVLKVMGSSFLRCKSKQEWEVQWKKVKQFPNKEIDQVLRISYDGLGKHEKEIFLDIACFHKGRRKNYVKECLDGCDFHGEAGINDLIDRSLILISYSRSFWMDKLEAKIEMHDLVQEMGRAIAREQRNRLFIAKDVYQVLTNNEIGGHVQAISFDLNEIKKLHLQLEHANFEKMHQLRFLRVSHFLPSIVSLDLPNSLRFLEWHDYPLKSLPSNFPGQNLVVVDTSSNNVEAQLWNEYQSPINLKRISLRFCYSLTEVPNLSWSLNIEHIDLRYCQSLVEIPSYFQDLNKLTYLNLGRSYNLKNLAEMPCNLEFLNLPYTAIEELPSSVWSHEKISHLDIRYCKHLKSLPSNSCKLKLSNSFSLEGCESLCKFWELPRNTTVLELSGTTIKELRNTSIESVVGLTSIKLINCKSLVSLPTNIWKLKYLESLDLIDCSNFQHLPEILEAMEHLVFLNLSGTAVKEVPPSIESVVGLTSIKLINCKSLVSLPTNIWKLKYLESLDLSGCSNFQHLPEILEAMEHLVFLNLSGTAVKELPPSIESVVGLTSIKLINCKSLVSLPTNIWKLKYLESLDLSGCSDFQHLPEILEAMEHLVFLNLSGTRTTVKELPPSIESVVGLLSIKLINCKSLVSLPTNIWKLKYLESLDLSGCSDFQHLPEILEAMEHLVFLNLSGTTVKELPPSIESVVGLTSIKLINCKSLVSLPTNIWKLKYLESLDLSGCSDFQHLPEILEAMEHLVFLNLSGTAVKELPPSIGNLVALRKLDLSWIEIKNIPASIKQATQLSHMCLINCESLESLPELPPLLQCLEAEDCTSLKTVSSSSTALAHGWEKYKFSRGLHEKHIFSDCRRLDENARSNIMGDAQLRIMRMATASSKFKEDKIEEKIEQASYDSDYFHDESEKEFFGKRSSVAIRCWGYEIPKWFSHQSEGSSIKIELPHDWFSTDFFGFALSFVVGFAAQKIGCKYNFKTSNGESHEVNHPLFYDSRINELTFVYEDSHEVFVWWYNNVFEEVIEEGRSPTAFYNHFTEVNVDFHLLNYHREPFPVGDEVEVEKCGICLLYGKDAEMIKQRALYAQDAEIQIFS